MTAAKMTILTQSAICPVDKPPSYKKAVSFTQTSDGTYEDLVQVACTSQTVPTFEQRSSSSSQFKPIVVPQTTANMLNMYLFPFVRAYPPCLAERGMSERQFLAFIDGLNEAFVISPVFRLLSAAGQVASFAPSAIAMGVGMGVTVASTLAGAVMSYKRSRKYIEKHNVETFAPIGLRVCLVSAKQLFNMLGLPKEYERQTTLRSNNKDPCVRRMNVLGDTVAPLCWNVEEARKPDKWMKKIGAWQARRSDAMIKRKTAKQNEKATQARIDGNMDEWEKQKRKIEEHERKVSQRIRLIVIVPVL